MPISDICKGIKTIGLITLSMSELVVYYAFLVAESTLPDAKLSDLKLC